MDHSIILAKKRALTLFLQLHIPIFLQPTSRSLHLSCHNPCKGIAGQGVRVWTQPSHDQSDLWDFHKSCYWSSGYPFPTPSPDRGGLLQWVV